MAEMDTDDLVDSKKSFQCNYHLFHNLNVVYNSSSSTIIFWNKFQLFLYEDFNFEDATRIFTPEFLVHQILVSNNYLVCLDCNGNVHVTSLKFKNCAQKRLKTNFQPREQNVLAWVQRNDHVLSLKLERERYSLCLNELVTELPKVKEIIIKYYDGTWPLPSTTQQKCFITACKVPENDENVKKLFNILSVKDYDIVIVTFDRMDVYACLFNQDTFEEELKLVKLYSSPSEICTIQILELEVLTVLIVLSLGTVIALPLVNPPPTPEALHLNTAVCKFTASKDTFIYTDGSSMWKTENSFTNIKFSQFFVRQVKDIVMFGDQLICTTYSNLFYLLPIENEKIYIQSRYTEFVPVEKLSNNSEYLYKVFEESKENAEVIKKVHEEGNYVTALALSNRPDLMDTVLQNEVVVYEHYEDAIKENPSIMLMEDLKEYFKPGSIQLLIKLNILQMEHLVNDVLEQLFDASKLHISLYSDDKLVKTNSMNVGESLNKIHVLIPFDSTTTNMSSVKVVVEIVLHIPDESKEPTWTTFFQKEIMLNPEHFIKTDLISSRNITMRDSEEPLEDLILKLAVAEHGSLLQFSSVSGIRGSLSVLPLYVKLPPNYKDIFKNKELCDGRFHPKKAEYLCKLLSSSDFLESKSNLTFEIGKIKVDVEIVTDELENANPILKVSSEDGKTAMGMRNFFAELIFNNIESGHPSNKFVNYSMYSTIESAYNVIRQAGVTGDRKEIHTLSQQFQKNTIGSLPI